MYYIMLDSVEFPIAPEKITTTVPAQNSQYTLLSGDVLNIAGKSGLRSIAFDLVLPQAEGSPYATYVSGYQSAIYYLNLLSGWHNGTEPVRLVIYRTNLAGEKLFATNMLVLLEDYKVVEAVDYGSDIVVSLVFSEFKDLGTVSYI